MTEPDVLRYFRLLRQHGLNHPTSGNASDRSGITKTGCNADDELSLVDWDSLLRSSDSPIHKFCYENRTDVHAILHAHPPYTLAVDMRQPSLTVIEADWNTDKEIIADALAARGKIFHRHHGVYVAAQSASDAYAKLCCVEHDSQILWNRMVLAR